MKWIKASERLPNQWMESSEKIPDDWYDVILRFVKGKELILDFSYEEGDDYIYILGSAKVKKPLLEDVEWLDESENDQAIEALQALHDVQNGPPLVKCEKDWNEAMKLAQEVLSKKLS